MRKVMNLAGLMLVAVFISMIWRGKLFARITGTPPTTADTFCVGPTNLEVCVDASANFLPTLTGVGSLGSSSYQWNNLFMSGNATVGGTAAITGAVTASGALTAGATGTANSAGTGNSTSASAVTNSGIQIFTKSAVGSGATAVQGIYQSTTVPVLTSYMTLIGSGTADVLLTAVPNIATTTTPGGATQVTNGTMLILTATQTLSGIIFQDAGTLIGSGLQLGASSRLVSKDKILMLIFNAQTGTWNEISYANN